MAKMRVLSNGLNAYGRKKSMKKMTPSANPYGKKTSMGMGGKKMGNPKSGGMRPGRAY